MKRTLKIKLDLEKGLQFSEEKIFTQGDLNTHFLNVILPEGLDLENKTMQINFIKPNKEVVYEIIDNLSQENEVKVSNNILDTPGKVYVEIILKKSDVEILTINKLAYFIVTQTIAGTNVEVKIGENTNTTITEKLLQLSKSLIETNEAIQNANQAKQNLQANIESYNENAIDKTNIFNQNSIGKTSDFNANAKTAVEDIKREGIKQINAVIDANQTTKIYGVAFEGSASKGTRTYNAVGMVANVGVGAEEVVNDFDDVIKTDEVIVDIDANGNLYEKAVKGQPGYNVSDGQVYIKFYKFYWNGSWDSPAISYTQTELTYIEIPTFYIAKYRAKIDENGKLFSKKGIFPSQGSLNTFFRAAQAYNKDCVTETMPAHMAMSLLFMIEFATRDAQTIMAGFSSGCYSESYKTLDDRVNTNTIKIDPNYSKNFRIGQTIVMNTSLSSSFKYGHMEITGIDSENGIITFKTEDGNSVENIPKDMCVYNYAWKTGSTDDVVASSGSMGDNTSGKYDCKYRGVETPYGSQYSWICDVGSSRNGEGTEESPYEYAMWYLKDPRKYQSNLSDNEKITEDYIKSSFNLGTTDGYIMKLGQDSREKRMCSPVQLGASSSTFYSDHYYYPRYATTALRVGGNLAIGRYCGFFYFDWYNRFSGSYWYCGARGVLLTVF